ncbi:rhodanese-like domain-containing protein [Snodgrassella sp. CFCC 13594]|uniref:rhodanese-like domain-containing protein n=1 Tax=Snodgrassella sp. CFCC 13594 TaxID=1775559 RepID=UPI0009EDEBE3|nr:rhodanese-like domain-containing protein [Snodgrassella sp. CFCC 13594]
MSTILQLKPQSFSIDTLPSLGEAIDPVGAWQLVQQGLAKLVDIRSHEERTFVGYIPEISHVPWANGTKLNRNPRFARELAAQVNKNDVVLLICRSGKRSALAAQEAIKHGFKHIYSVAEGFEGDLDEYGHRGGFNGWRFHHLPWQQD